MQETCLISSHSFPMPCNSFRVSWPFADGYRSSRGAVTLVHDSGLGNFNQMHGLPLGVGLSFTGSLLHLKYSKTFTIPLNSWTLVMHALPTEPVSIWPWFLLLFFLLNLLNIRFVRPTAMAVEQAHFSLVFRRWMGFICSCYCMRPVCSSFRQRPVRKGL